MFEVDAYALLLHCAPVNDALMELLVMTDALKSSQPRRSPRSFRTTDTRGRIVRSLLPNPDHS